MGLVRSRPGAVDTATRPPAPEGEAGTFARLSADLAAPDAGLRRAAARALADHPAAADALCGRLEVETAPSVRAMILTTLIRLQSPAVADRLAGFLRSDDAALRNAAIEALREMPEAIAPRIDTLLADSDDDVRLFAVNILAEIQHARAPDWLAEVIRRDPHINVCAAAVDGLAEIGGPEMIADLERLKQRFPDHPFMDFAIDTAIRRIRGT